MDTLEPAALRASALSPSSSSSCSMNPEAAATTALLTSPVLPFVTLVSTGRTELIGNMFGVTAAVASVVGRRAANEKLTTMGAGLAARVSGGVVVNALTAGDG
ncbi:hypothetical protein EON62_02785 [archaeon]|nr:MAG: hypothetical protein EON62_02785 [archaeon]